MSFVHLRLHSEYSLVDGIVRVKPLANAVAESGMPAVALTDQSNLFAMVKFYRAMTAAGVKPIIGADLWLQGENETAELSRLLLLCQSRQGYLNLSRLISRSYVDGQVQGVPAVKREWIAQASEGLIALSATIEGEIGRALLAAKHDLAERLLADWKAVFPGRFYLELQRTGRSQEEDYLHAAVALAAKTATPVVATNDVRFIDAAEFEAHEARVCIHEGRTLADPRRKRQYSQAQYLRSPLEMAELFSDIPEAIANTIEIARRCSFELKLGQTALPDFPVPQGMDVNSFLAQEAQAGLEARLKRVRELGQQAQDEQVYRDRLQLELDVIVAMGFPGYFLIVADFIRWSKSEGIPVGPGRGSGAGSLVAWALGITDLDPIHYELLFERFLNPERVSLPDFDIDFCIEGRDRVIDYVAKRYGQDQVSQIITYGSMAARAVVRDVGRVLGHPYGFVDQVAKLIPFELGMTLEKALAQEELLKQRYEEEEEVTALLDLAMSLEGLARNAGKHAGGVVIAPSALTNFTPLYCEPGGRNAVTQFDKDDVEAIGLVKFDFLGLRTLTIIDRALRAANETRLAQGEPEIALDSIPMDDTKTFDLLKACATTAVFQLESRGMKELIKRLQPDCFDDVVALVALFRPGPLQSGMVDDFIDRKHGRQKADYMHPSLEPVLRSTYGVILYQEQVMQAAQVLAGYTLGGADLLRRAMGKKKPEEMAKQRSFFVDGAAQRGCDRGLATRIFDLIEKFAGYGFNKSHSVAYALIAYQTAYLKAHYPAQFMAAVLSSDMDNTDKVKTLIDECRDMGIKLLPPNVNQCRYEFRAADDDTILYGLGAIKGVGEGAVQDIVGERRQGSYDSFYDLLCRIDSRKLNKRVHESLVRSGALDCFGLTRASLMVSLPNLLAAAEKHSNDCANGMGDLFGSMLDRSAPGVSESAAVVMLEEWSEPERLRGERDTLGLYLTGHPVSSFREELQRFTSASIGELKVNGEQGVVIAGLISDMRTMNSRRGDRIAFVTLDDNTGRIEVAVFADAFRSYRDLLSKDRIVVVEGMISTDEYTGGYKMSADRIWSIEQARESFAKAITVDVGETDAGLAVKLAEALRPFRQGRCNVLLNYQSARGKVKIPLPEDWRVRPSDELLHRLRQLTHPERVHVVY